MHTRYVFSQRFSSFSTVLRHFTRTSEGGTPKFEVGAIVLRRITLSFEGATPQFGVGWWMIAGMSRPFVALLTALALLAAACSSSGAGDEQAQQPDPTQTTFPQAADPGDPEGFVPLDTGPGLDWERVEHPGFSLGFIVYSSTQFVTVNTREDGLTELLTSPDGLTWTDAGRTFDDIEVRDLAVSREALAVWGERRDSMSGDPTGNIARVHYSPDNGTTWSAKDIRPPGLPADADNPGSQIVTAAIRGNTLLVSAFFRNDESAHLLELDLADPNADFTTVDLEPAGTFIGDITVTASGIVMIGSDAESSRIYVEGADGFERVEPDTRIATLLSDGRILYANNWESYELLQSVDLGSSWQPVEQDFRAFSQTFVGPAGMAGTNTISTSEPWAIDGVDGPPQLGTESLDRTRPETYLSWSPNGRAWHHETATSAFGFPAFAYLAIGDGLVLAAATPLFGEPYEEGTVPTELFLARTN